MKKASMCQYHKLNDCIGQRAVNHAYEKAFKEGKSKPSRGDFNKAWTKLAGKNNPYKGKLPKYDKERGSRSRMEKLFNEIFD